MSVYQVKAIARTKFKLYVRETHIYRLIDHTEYTGISIIRRRIQKMLLFNWRPAINVGQKKIRVSDRAIIRVFSNKYVVYVLVCARVVPSLVCNMCVACTLWQRSITRRVV